MIRRPPRSTLFPYRRSSDLVASEGGTAKADSLLLYGAYGSVDSEDRKSTRLNSSHQIISYAVFCLKKKKKRMNLITDTHTWYTASRYIAQRDTRAEGHA